MNIILIAPEEVTDNQVTLTDKRAAHITNVLKADCGHTLRTGLINGPIGSSRVVALEKNAVTLATNHNGPPPAPPQTDLILALPRPIMLKRIFSQTATLGVGRIFLIKANRVEKSFFSASLLERKNFYPHLLHGLEQAVDTLVPKVSIHTRFKPFIEDYLPEIITNYQEKIVAHPGNFPALPQRVSLPIKQKTLLAIGPEGGWVDYEIEKFKKVGIKPFSMGPRILRVDTAVPALLSQIELLRSVALG